MAGAGQRAGTDEQGNGRSRHPGLHSETPRRRAPPPRAARGDPMPEPCSGHRGGFRAKARDRGHCQMKRSRSGMRCPPGQTAAALMSWPAAWSMRHEVVRPDPDETAPHPHHKPPTALLNSAAELIWRSPRRQSRLPRTAIPAPTGSQVRSHILIMCLPGGFFWRSGIRTEGRMSDASPRTTELRHPWESDPPGSKCSRLLLLGLVR